MFKTNNGNSKKMCEICSNNSNDTRTTQLGSLHNFFCDAAKRSERKKCTKLLRKVKKFAYSFESSLPISLSTYIVFSKKNRITTSTHGITQVKKKIKSKLKTNTSRNKEQKLLSMEIRQTRIAVHYFCKKTPS